jgi:excisionase family DNA binding protein
VSGAASGGAFEQILEEVVRRAVRDELQQVLDLLREELAAAARPSPRAYSFDEAAQVLNVSPRTLRRKVDRGELPAIGIGSRRLVLVSAVDDYLAAQGEAAGA